MSRDLCPKCGSGTALGSYICFKCSYLPIARKFTQHISKDLSNDLYVSEDLIFNPKEFHIDALKWLYRYEIYDEIILANRLGYDPIKHAVFLPVFYENKLSFYQYRYLKDNPPLKYKTTGKAHNHLNIFNIFNHVENTVVIVEDLISAIKVQAHYPALFLAGSTLKENNINELIYRFTNIIFWLDPDDGGIKGKNNLINKIIPKLIKNQSRALYIKSSANLTKLFEASLNLNEDPKVYNNLQIKDILKNQMNEVNYNLHTLKNIEFSRRIING